MRAVEMEQSEPTAPVTEQHEIFAEDAQAQRDVAEIARERDRLPEAPEIFAARRAGTDAGQLVVGQRDPAHVIPTVRRVEESRCCHRSPTAPVRRLSPSSV